eukprot:scaffold33265_cov58-Phaeocystis_antarctica.AAC.2
MRLSRVTFLFRMLGVSYACVTAARPLVPYRPSPRLTTTPDYHPCVIEGGRLLGVLTRLDLVEDAKGMGRALRGVAPQMGTVACLGISRGNSVESTLESTSSSRRSSTDSVASCDANNLMVML